MKQYRMKIMLAILGIAGFFAILGIVGDYDYCEWVILRMTQEEYDSVRHLLTEKNGSVPSERDIAHWWDEHHNSK